MAQDRTHSPFLPAGSWTRFGPPFLVALLSFAVFTPALEGDFVNFDDLANFTNNPYYRGLSGPQLRWMFSHFEGHYQPLTWLSHGFDYALWGMDPWGYHLLNLLLHSANALLVYLLLLDLLPRVRSLETARNTGRLRWAAAVGALVFAIHPLRVESVAWITERRDVLFLFFALLSLLFYLRAHSDETDGTPSRRAIAISVSFFALSMLSKAMCMTLPVLLLLLDAYPLHRLGSRDRVLAAVREKIPYFAILLAGIAAELIAQSTGRAIDPESTHGLEEMVSQPAYRLGFYLWKTLVPTGLHPMYLIPPDRDATALVYLLCAVGVLITSLLLVATARRVPALLAAWLAFALLLTPVLGLVQVGFHFAADRNTYFAGVVPGALLAGGLLYWWRRGESVRISAAAAVAILAVLAGLSFVQSRVWLSSIALWQHTVEVDPDNHIGHYNLAHELAAIGEVDRAIVHYSHAIRLREDEPRFWYNRGLSWYAKGDMVRAVSDFGQAVALDPQHWMAFSNRGMGRLELGDFAGAVTDFTRAIELMPDRPAPYFGRARALEQLGDERAARADRERSRQLRSLSRMRRPGDP